jgi:transposase
MFVQHLMDLTEQQWSAIKKHIPGPERQGTSSRGGRPWRDPRDVLNAVLWVLRTGAPWADLPRRYPPYQTCHRRFQHWVETGVLPKVLAALRRDLESRGGIEDVEGYIDGTYVPAKKGGTASVGVEQARRPNSWRLQTAMVFHSLCILQLETDSTVCSPSELSTLHSWKNCHLD